MLTFNPFPVTGNPVFDYFFSIVFMVGCVSFGPYLLFNVFKRY